MRPPSAAVNATVAATKVTGMAAQDGRQTERVRALPKVLHPGESMGGAVDGVEVKAGVGDKPKSRDASPSLYNDEDARVAEREGRDQTMSPDGSCSSSESSSSEESASSSSPDEDVEKEPPAPLLRPVFVPRAARATEAVRLQIEKAEAREEERAAERVRSRVEEAQNLAAEAVGREEASEAGEGLGGAGDGLSAEERSRLPDDTDHPGLGPNGVCEWREDDEDEDYIMWKVREIKRVIRDQAIGAGLQFRRRTGEIG
jgi:hypothetical protein